jgi:hypothetical protein
LAIREQEAQHHEHAGRRPRKEEELSSQSTRNSCYGGQKPQDTQKEEQVMVMVMKGEDLLIDNMDHQASLEAAKAMEL